ncbi:hypothetical protein CAOG_008139 [Capsaspora owczarzaki ATCC 30864]|uniref:Uncharacterized protein n=2 Tax=Capsaspora owczarzaki (strain ATCC 30864) TaxID=595528 RepID=A0A0D2WYP8_CAPO3|nr:hypothetical protein CAOG_008139 [Capsaspora owczarzaki ATCC 30864]
MSGKLRVNDSDSWVDSDSQLHGGQEMRLTDVDLSDSTVTPVGMQHFSNLKHLKRLDLSGNSYLTDDSIARLVDSPLQVLNVSNTPLTDKCVSSLTSMSALQELDVRETKLSVNARSRLQAALPKCQVHIS